MKLEQNLNLDFDSPKILHSGILSRKIGYGVSVDIMDFSQTRTKSHKGIKARHGLEHVNGREGDYALIFTSGNAGPAFDIVAMDYDIQVVKFVNKNVMKKLMNVREIGKDRGGKNRYSITIQLPDKWFGPKKLERFWKRLIRGKKRGYRNDGEFDKLTEIVKDRGLNPLNAFDVTNIRDYCRKGNPHITPEVKRAVRKYDYCFVPFGSGEFFSAWQEAANKLWFSKPVLVAVTTYENPISLAQQEKSVNGFRLRKKHRKSHADKLDTPRVGEEHKRSVAMADKRTYFCSLNDRLIDRAYKSMGLVRKEYRNLNTTKTGSICLGVFDKEHVEYLGRRKGIEVKGTYRFDPKEIEFYEKKLVMKPLIIRPGSRILVVNTGGLS